MELLTVLKKLLKLMASSDCTVVYPYSFMEVYQNLLSGMDYMTRLCNDWINETLLLFRFGAFETFKTRMMDHNGQLSTAGKLLAGLGAGVCEAILAVTPMETVKVKFINDQRSANPQFRGFFHGVSTIIKQEGFMGVYKGLTATIIKQGSNQAIRFYVMETMKDMYKGDDPKKPVPKLLVGVFGAVAGAASVFGNTPIDVVKTRMQGLEASKYKNTADCAMKIWKNEGPAAFYKGTVPRLGRVCLDVAITFMIYDSFMDLFNKFWH